MKIRHSHTKSGSALILVVVVTVLLAVIGIMFLMVSRAGETEAGAIVQSKDLDAAVDTVVNRIHEVLVDDLFGRKQNPAGLWELDGGIVNGDQKAISRLDRLSDEPWDAATHHSGNSTDLVPGQAWDDMIDPGANAPNFDPLLTGANVDIWLPGQLDDYWLASLEPKLYDNGTPANPNDDYWAWPQVTDLWGSLHIRPDSLFYQRFVNTQHVFYPQAISRFWVDPDDDQVPAQWGAGNPVWNAYKVSAKDVRTRIIKPKDRIKVIQQGVPANVAEWKNPNNTYAFGARADADGDGVADSRWAQVPNLTTGRGEPVFAAVRIIDNCGMLNLNAACNFYSQGGTNPNTSQPYNWNDGAWEYTTGTQYNPSGRYLTELNYRFFLRGQDRVLPNPKRIERARDPKALLFNPKDFHNALMTVENPVLSFVPFDLGDELEIRNRYVLTGLPICRFENGSTAYETFDWGRGNFTGGWTVALRSKRIPCTDLADLAMWQQRLNPAFSDNMSGNPNLDYYDRRHLCTFYSFDRNLPYVPCPVLTSLFGLIADPHLRQNVQAVFAAKGPASTNIETPLAVDTAGLSRPYNNLETRRKILHLLYALRAYYIGQGDPIPQAALKAAQVTANIIDYSDDGSNNPYTGTDPRAYGPFYDAAYGTQKNKDCTYLNTAMIDAMILEVSNGQVNISQPAWAAYNFGLGTETVFGFERQPFFAEISVEWNGMAPNSTTNIAIELVNPYYDPIDLTGWKLKIGSTYTTGTLLNGVILPAADGLINKTPGRLVLYSGPASYTDSINSYNGNDHGTRYRRIVTLPLNLTAGHNNTIVLTGPAPAGSTFTEIVMDRIADADFDNSSTGKTIFKGPSSGGGNGFWTAAQVDTNWNFIKAGYVIKENAATVGKANNLPQTANAFQLAVSNNGEPVGRWGDIETLSLYGNRHPGHADANCVTSKIALNAEHFDFEKKPQILNYIAPMNRSAEGSLPGRININTAPVHVIAAALPPDIIRLKNDPNTAMSIAQMIVANRPYKKLSQLLDLGFFKRLDGDAADIFFSEGPGFRRGDDQLVMEDIEERHWFMTHLANKFTVRSDTFTAYILIRLGDDGPQRRMIAIFDRSQVWTKDDRPKLVALHPVPDPR